ncbi:MAG: DNA-3-methyladenine glycosylase I [Bacteroidetes bacterium]|nr:DNA-3-methyladenine glycosylase I [Bacteroidota bacterium]
MTARCPWPGQDDRMLAYHDQEWGVPIHDDRQWFEKLVLDTAQAGLSWKTILHKREGYREAFHLFDVERVAAMTDDDVEDLMQNPGIVRNRMKIRSTISNAKAFMAVQKEFGSFDQYIWSFTGGKRVVNQFRELKDFPARTDLSDRISKDLKKRGFSFVGSTVVYAFIQAGGIVDDHTVTCFRKADLASGFPV